MKRMPKRKYFSLASIAVLALFGVIGATLVVVSRAATSVIAAEVESGTLQNATQVSDTTASNNAAVKFTGSVSGTVTHGSQISQANTGYLAWTGPNGEKCTDSNIQVYNSSVSASSIGASATCVHFKGGININAPITLTACKIDGVVNTQNRKTTINYCTVVSPTPQDWALGPGNFTAIRSQLMGNSDGVRYGGSTNDTLIENYIRTKEQAPDDHNDGVQMYGATGGGTMLRNNIDVRPVGGGGGVNGAIFVADGATGTYEVRDNYLLGGNYTLRLHENGYYRATGNIVEKGTYLYSPFNSDQARAGAFLEYANNRLSDGTLFGP